MQFTRKEGKLCKDTILKSSFMHVHKLFGRNYPTARLLQSTAIVQQYVKQIMASNDVLLEIL